MAGMMGSSSGDKGQGQPKAAWALGKIGAPWLGERKLHLTCSQDSGGCGALEPGHAWPGKPWGTRRCDTCSVSKSGQSAPSCALASALC